MVLSVGRSAIRHIVSKLMIAIYHAVFTTG